MTKKAVKESTPVRKSSPPSSGSMRLGDLLVEGKLQIGYQSHGHLKDIRDRAISAKEAENAGICRVIRMQDVDWEREELATKPDELFHIIPTRKPDLYTVGEDDVLLCTKGKHMKAITLTRDALGPVPVLAVSAFVILRLRTKIVSPGYLAWFLNSGKGQELIMAVAGGDSGAPFLRKGDILDLCVPVPSIRLQREIVSLLRAFKYEISDLQNYIAEKKLAVDRFCTRVANQKFI